MKSIPASLKNRSPYVAKRFFKARDLVSCNNLKNILDIGCNDGFFLSLLDDEIEKYGVDLLEENMLHDSRIKYKKHDIAKGLPYDEASFDVVNSSEVIEHMLDTEFFLKECYRVLKPGGKAVISTPNLHYWRNIVEWLKGNQFFFIDYHKNQEGHIRYFCPRSLQELACGVGFRNIQTITVGDWGGRSIMMKTLAAFFEKFSTSKNLILFMHAEKSI